MFKSKEKKNTNAGPVNTVTGAIPGSKDVGEVILAIIDGSYLKDHSQDFRSVKVSSGEVLLVEISDSTLGGQNQTKVYTNETIPFITNGADGKKIKPTKTQKKELGEIIDISEGNVSFIDAFTTTKNYSFTVEAYTSDWATVKVRVSIKAHITAEDVGVLRKWRNKSFIPAFDDDGMPLSTNAHDIPGAMIISKGDIESEFKFIADAVVCGIIREVNSTEVYSGNHREKIISAIEELKSDWLELGFTIEDMRISFDRMLFERAKMGKRVLEDNEIYREAQHAVEMKMRERQSAIKSFDEIDSKNLELRKACIEQEIFEHKKYGPEEFRKDRELERSIAYLKAKADADEAHKGYIEGYLAGYKDGQNDLQRMIAAVSPGQIGSSYNASAQIQNTATDVPKKEAPSKKGFFFSTKKSEPAPVEKAEEADEWAYTPNTNFDYGDDSPAETQAPVEEPEAKGAAKKKSSVRVIKDSAGRTEE